MARRVIDLSQPLSNATQLHPFFPTVQILRQMVHSDAPPEKKSFDAEIIITSNHAATHVDALAHFDPAPGAPKIAEMPLDTFCGEAVCVDVREYPAGHEVTVAELERAIEASGQEVRAGDILLSAPTTTTAPPARRPSSTASRAWPRSACTGWPTGA